MENHFLDLLFPKFCLGCGFLGAYLCFQCESTMKRVKIPKCFYCNNPSLLGLTHPKCRQKKGVDGFLSLYLYTGLFVKILRESKYKGAYEVLFNLLTFSQRETHEKLYKWNNLFTPSVTSLPLHPQRLRERGFNQSEIISNYYFSSSRFYKETLLDRTINTDHLANIGNRKRRKQHIRGAFSFHNKTIPKAALLVDDVVTSGSTILECSKVLKENGVQTVLAFSLAKG